MAESVATQKLRNRVKQRQREGWRLIELSEDPPRARLHKRERLNQRSLSGRARVAATPSYEDAYRTIWVDDDGKLQEQEGEQASKEQPEQEQAEQQA